MGSNDSKLAKPQQTQQVNRKPQAREAVSSNITIEEKNGLTKTFAKWKTIDNFKQQFKLSTFIEVVPEDELTTNILNIFEKITESKIVNTQTNTLEMTFDKYEDLFEKLMKDPALKRVGFYFSLFPSVELFFKAAMYVSVEEPTHVDDIIKLFTQWVEKETENKEGMLLNYEGNSKKFQAIKLLIQYRVPRLLSYLDSWLYYSFTSIKIGPAKVTSKSFFSENEEKEIPEIFKINTYRWFFSICFAPQMNFINFDRIITNEQALKFFPFDIILSSTTQKPCGEFINTLDVIYSIHRDGSGMNRYLRAVYGYPAASLLIIETENNEIFGGYNSMPWPRNQKTYFGDEFCFLFTLQPELAIYSSRGISKNYIRFIEKEGGIGHDEIGISFGGKPGNERIWIDGDQFTKGRKAEMCSTYYKGPIGDPYEDTFVIKNLVVIGLGGKPALDYQQDVRVREEKFAERSRKVDAAAFFGEGQSNVDNADTVIMEWMGIGNHNHGHREDT